MNIFRRSIVATAASSASVAFAQNRGEHDDATVAESRSIYSLWLVPKNGSPFEVTARDLARKVHEQARSALEARAGAPLSEREKQRLLEKWGYMFPPLHLLAEEEKVVAMSPAEPATEPGPFPPHVQIGRSYLAAADHAILCGRSVASKLSTLPIELSTSTEHAASKVKVQSEAPWNGVAVEVQATPALRMANVLANVMIDGDAAVDTGLQPQRIEDAFELTQATFRPHISFLFDANAECEKHELKLVADHVRSAFVKHLELADGFIACELAVVKRGQTYDKWEEVARFPL